MAHEADRHYPDIAGETLNNGGATAGWFMIAAISGITGGAWGLTVTGAVADFVAVTAGALTARSLRN